MNPGLGMLASGNPLEHVVQHPLVTTEVGDWGPFWWLAPNHVVTLLSDQIVMLIVAGVLLAFLVPRAIRRRRGTGEIDRLVPTGFAIISARRSPNPRSNTIPTASLNTSGASSSSS